MDTKALFEKIISEQEKTVVNTAVRFDDETQEDFDAKIARRIKFVCVGVSIASKIPDINAICPGQSTIWEGFKVERRRVDHLDNVYISRA